MKPMYTEEDKRMENSIARVIRLYFNRTQDHLSEYGLFRGQPPILALLVADDGMSQKTIADKLDLSPATVTVTLKRMEKSGLVTRHMDERDQRVLRVHITEKGRDMFNKSEQTMIDVTEEILEGFTTEERRVFHDFIARMAENMESKMEKQD